MPQDTHIQQLVINVLTRAQYDSLTSIDPDQLYYITDDETFAKIDDSLVSLVKTWSSSKINTLIGTLQDALELTNE